MNEHHQRPARFGAHASVIQLLASLLVTAMDGGTTQAACTLASLLFWGCSASLLYWRGGIVSQIEWNFHRWALLAFVLIGTPLFRPIIESQDWLLPWSYPILAVQLVVPMMYLLSRVLGVHSPFDGTPPAKSE